MKRSKKRITKFEKQWKQIKKNRIRITKKEFKRYYELVRKANRKLSASDYVRKAFDTRKFSYSISHIKTTSEFKKRFEKVKSVLGRNYRIKSNLEMRNRLYRNIENSFELGGASKLVQMFEQLSDNELIEFMKSNPDIEHITYESEESLERYIDLVGLTLDKIGDRLKARYRRMKAKFD